jgi:hypothetical protein
VFRAVILTIVLTFTAASNPSPLCMVCCHAAVAVGSGCHNDMSSSMAPHLIANRDCGPTFNSAAVRDELRPTLSAPAAGDALLNVVHTVLNSSRERDLRAHPWTAPPLPQQRPLTVLRI